MKYCCAILLYCAFSLMPAFGQEPALDNEGPILSKEEAIAYTLENNLGIQVSENLREIDLNNADILNSGFLPTVTGLAGGSINRENTEGQLANGETRTAEGVETRRYNASLNMNYVLFDGMGRYYNYKAFQELSDQSELEVRQTIETTLLQLFSVYYEVARLEENTTNLQEALNISRNRLERARFQFEYGQNTGLDVLNAEVDVNTDSVNLLNAKQLLRNTRRDLNLILNRDLSESFQADTTVTFVPSLRMEEILAEAKVNNVRMLLAEKDILISEYDMKAARSGYLPTIGLTGSYAVSYTHLTLPTTCTPCSCRGWGGG